MNLFFIDYVVVLIMFGVAFVPGVFKLNSLTFFINPSHSGVVVLVSE